MYAANTENCLRYCYDAFWKTILQKHKELDMIEEYKIIN